jgi:hypothetical protein
MSLRPRQAVWREGEVVRLIKYACWRRASLLPGTASYPRSDRYGLAQAAPNTRPLPTSTISRPLWSKERHMDLVKRYAEIVTLVKSRKPRAIPEVS